MPISSEYDQLQTRPPSTLPEMAEYLKGTSTMLSNPGRTHGLTILITGANSGIGLEAAKLFALIYPINRIFLVARDEVKAQYAKEQVEKTLEMYADSTEQQDELQDWSENLIPLACDQSSLESVRAFHDELRMKLITTYRGHKWALNGIDVLCLNAAVLFANGSQAQHTKDGYEATFQTNYLAPFLLTNLIKDMINPGARVVISTSGLWTRENLGNMSGFRKMIARAHKSGLCTKDSPSGSHLFDELEDISDSGEDSGCHLSFPDQHFLSREEIDITGEITADMVDGSEFHFKRSYAFSKLCNVGFCVELNRRLRGRNDGSFATLFSPGLMTSSGLWRYQDISNWHYNPGVLQREKTVLWGAGSLVFMSVSDNVAAVEGAMYWCDEDSNAASNAIYGKDFSPVEITDEQLTESQAEELWNLSCQAVQIQSTGFLPQYKL